MTDSSIKFLGAVVISAFSGFKKSIGQVMDHSPGVSVIVGILTIFFGFFIYVYFIYK